MSKATFIAPGVPSIPGLELNKPCAFSPCGNYRYTLWRTWGRGSFLNVVGLNPSTADDRQDDPTIRRCIGFAKLWGYSGLCMTNLFAWRATDPLDMRGAAEPIGPDNDRWLAACAQDAASVLAAWGSNGTHLGRAGAVVRLLAQRMILPQCLGLTKDGNPKHPLYLAADTPREEYKPWA